MLLIRTFLVLIGLTIISSAHAQSFSDSTSSVVSISYINAVSNKAENVKSKIANSGEKELKKLQRQEERIQKKLAKIDSTQAKELLDNSREAYKNLETKFNSVKGKYGKYIPSLDTLSSSLKFLHENPQFLTAAKDAKKKLDEALGKTKELQSQLAKAENIRQFLKERREYLKNQLEQFGFAKQLKKINKQVYYYSQQLNEYKSLLKDHKKAERKAIELLSKTTIFKDFMRKNSELASLFRLPGDPADPTSSASLAGLQTRSQVNNLIQQQIASGGSNAQQEFQQNVQQAQSQLNELKNKILKAGGGGSDLEMPEGFKPNNQKTKSFLKRLEYGINMQSQKANGFFPVTSDIGLSIGYKLNDKGIIGIGGSYKLGWGANIQNIKLTNEGLGLRSFIDWKIKGSFWITGGYEMNYRSAFSHVNELKDLNGWQQSGLMGISKQISLRSKILKKTKLQLLWDFLSYQQVPRTQPVLFRVGYTFN